MNIRKRTLDMVIMAVLIAILIVMSVTPLGYLTIGPLSITLNMIPVAIGAILLGPVGGGILGLVFGITSFLKGAGILPPDVLGAQMFSVSPVNTAIVAILPRVLEGVIGGLVASGLKRIARKDSLPSLFRNKALLSGIVGFVTALMNTVLFLSTLAIFFEGTLKEMGVWKKGVNVFEFLFVFIVSNALIELAVATVLTAIIGFALYKARLVNRE